MKVIVRQCRDCERDMVTDYVYRKRVLPRDRYTQAGAHGLCSSCYAQVRRHGADPTGPVPPRKYLSPGQPCRDCGRPLLSQKTYRSDIDRYKQLGYVSMGAHGMCAICYKRAWLCQTLPDPAPRRAPARQLPRADDDGPLDAVKLARLRAAVGLG